MPARKNSSSRLGVPSSDPHGVRAMQPQQIPSLPALCKTQAWNRTLGRGQERSYR